MEDEVVQFTDLEPWASGRELGLRSTLTKMESVLAEMEGKEIHNVELVTYIKKVRRQKAQAEDLLSELDYYSIEGVLGRDDEAGQGTTESSSPTNLQIVPCVSNPMVSAGNTVPEARTGILQEIDGHTKACRGMTKYLQDALQIENLVDRIHTVKGSQSTGGTDPRETSSFATQPKLYGREREQQLILSKLTSQESAGEKLSVLAIIGHGGVGKTTLCNVVYNDPAVSKHFEIRLWAYISVYFDPDKVMHELLEQLIGEKHRNLKGLKELQDNLAYALKSKRVLLVMDDLWEDTQEQKWGDLLSPLLSNEVQGNKILVTTRKPSVAKFTTATEHINLDGLKPDDFWKLFKECVFGDENYRREQRLQDLGRKIVVELKGNPLAAKSVGKVLRRNLNFESWTKILNDGEWKHEEDDLDIMPALMISYKYLPDDLKPCFSYCSVFPKYHRYEKERLVNMWIALGFISATDMPRRLEDIGSELFNDLVEWGFLEIDLGYGRSHIMHDLIYDLAQRVSSHENCSIGDCESRKAPQLVRHVSIITDSQYRRRKDGSVGPNEHFLQGFSSFFEELQNEKLSTLMLFGPHDMDFANTIREELTEVRSVRVLKLEMAVFDLDSMIRNISAFVNLRYLELGCSYDGSRLELPEDICKLYHLQVLDIKKNWGPRTFLPRGMNKLVKLRHFIAVDEVLAQVPGIGKMVSLQELKAFGVRRTTEFSISQLKSLNQLRGSMSIYNLYDVVSQEEAIEASISDKVHLTTLQLSWYDMFGASASFSEGLAILEDLIPHSDLLNLRIEGYGHSVPSWLGDKVHLTSLRSLHLNHCSQWRTIPRPDQLPLLRELHLIRMFSLHEIEIGCLEVLELYHLPRLRQCRVVDREQLSVNLRVLEVLYCDRLKEFPVDLFISNDLQSQCQFTRLHRLNASENERHFGHNSISQLLLIDSLKHIDLISLQYDPEEFRLAEVGQLKELRMVIKGRPQVARLEGRLFQCSKLRDLVELEISDYPELASLPWVGFQQLASLKKLKMIRCKLFSGNVGLSLPPSVEQVEFHSCNIKGTQVSQLLLNLTSLKNLTLANCVDVTCLPVGLFADEPNQVADGSWIIPPNCVTTLESLQISFGAARSMMHFSSDKGHFGRFVTLKNVIIDCPISVYAIISGVASDIPRSSLVKLHVQRTKDIIMQLSEFSSLVELCVSNCPDLTCVNLHSCTALQELQISGCGSLKSLEGLQSCQALRKLSIKSCEVFSSLSVSLNTLTELSIERNPKLETMNLHSCTALQKLCIADCAEMSCEGLKSLVGLQDLQLRKSTGFTKSWVSAAAKDDNSERRNCFPQKLQVLHTDDIGFLCMPICSQLSSLNKLTIHGDDEPPLGHLNILTDDNEKAMLCLSSLRVLLFDKVKHLTSLPADLHYLASLERLVFEKCPSITYLPVGALPASLKDLHIFYCSKELGESCTKMPRSRKLHLDVVE